MNDEKIDINEIESIHEYKDYNKDELMNILTNQKKIIFNLRNRCICLQNKLEYLEHKMKNYVKLCNIILGKINNNPISSFWFLHSLKKKIKSFCQNN